MIRDAQIQDVDALAELWHAGWQDAHAPILPAELARHRTLESFRQRMSDHLTAVRMAGEPGAPLGFYMLQGEELYQFYVGAAARGTGLAATLLADAEATLLRRGVRDAWLACAIGNDRAARFYEKNGWRRAENKVLPLPLPDGGVFPLEVWNYIKALK